ncbi:hypothetical protein HY448_01365 [Candidatus Pacearchaeota archaeon]|nr:hypothetical protein [Candidatus Pacearchaeota archaeon]
MESEEIKSEDIRKLIKDVAMIKGILFIDEKDPEGEISDWAKNALEEARKRKRKIPHEEARKMILGK